ncbi:MAG: hypothetical protein JJT90_09010 [Ectothiorhodospiraceae bacterium]|nr:hypothetical protein [Ectothiorhodospiraceae bacterium]
MSDWLLEERQELLKQDLWATLKANGLVMVFLAALVGAAFVVGQSMGLDAMMMSTVLMLLVFLLAPALGLGLMDWLRTRFWLRSSRERLRRLRSLRYLTHYVDLIGEQRLASLPDVVRSRVDKALKREAEGYLVREADYARALQVVLQFDPHGEDTPKRRRRGPGRLRR